jgi:hypothetical protein
MQDLNLHRKITGALPPLYKQTLTFHKTTLTRHITPLYFVTMIYLGVQNEKLTIIHLHLTIIIKRTGYYSPVQISYTEDFGQNIFPQIILIYFLL